MATDIDIEEHDVLDDSKVMGIFPDLSLVKIEIPDDDDEDTATHPTSNPEAIPDSTTGYDSLLPFERTSESPHVVSSTQDDGSATTPKIVGIQSAGNIFNNRIVLGQKATPLPISVDNASSVPDGMCEPLTLAEDIDAQTSNGVMGLEMVNNRIVLGQKPSSVPPDEVETSVEDLDEDELMKCYSATVILDDWGPYLNSSDSYCQECEILFATTNALDAHKMTAHSFLVAVEAMEPAPIGSKACFVCQKSFSNHTDLIQHIYHHVATTQKCNLCHETFLSQKLLSEHKKTHVKKEIDFASEKCVLYKCRSCGKFDRTLIEMKRHFLKDHCKQTLTPDDYKVFDGFKCGMCAHVSEGTDAYRAHLLQHKSYRISPKTYAKPQNSLPKDEGVFVPKSTLFCCSACDVHFTSLSVAFSHKKKCPDTPSQDCSQCPLTFASACMESHEVQHLYVDNGDFDVIDLATEQLVEKVLCVCPKCDVQCSLRSLWSHVGSCPLTPTYHCQDCDIYLDKAAENDHRYAHDAYRLSKSDFITVEYLTTEDLEADNKVALQNVLKVGTKRKLDEDVESEGSKRPKVAVDIAAAGDKEFTYCYNCRFFLPKSSIIKTKAHLSGQCRMHIKRVCATCGLVLSKYSYPRHRRLHHLPGFTFDDFKFFDLETDERIAPPVPDIFQCRKCQCHFLQSASAVRHQCPAKDTKFCTRCNRKYSQLAYKVHKKYHGGNPYKRPTQPVFKKPKEEPLTKLPKGRLNQSLGLNGDSIPIGKDILVIYCIDCKCCFMGDGHKCLGASWMDELSRARYRRGTCGICGIILGIDCYKNHLKLHSATGVTLEDFKFVNFNRVPFLNKPMPIYYPCKTCRVQFHSRADRRIHRCNTKSVLCNVCNLKFSPTAIRLHTPFHKFEVMESPKDNLVYQCVRCTYVFSKEQALNPICRHSCKGPKKASSHKYCEVCHLDMYKGIYDKHLRDHNNVKIVLFNPNVKPKDSDAVTMFCDKCELYYDFEKGKKKACLECGAILLSGTMHIERDHQQRSDMQTTSEAIKRRYVYYQCKYCKQAIRLKAPMMQHLARCSFKNYVLDPMKYCPTCDLHLLRKRFHCHEKSHARFPNLCKDTITVILCGKNSKQPLIEYRNPDAKPNIEERFVTTVGRKYKFYQCRNCNGVVTKMYRFKTHDCSKMDIVRLFHCRVCKLNIVLALYSSHLKYHSTHPDLMAKNIHILPFGEKRGARSVVVDADQVKRLAKLYASDTKATLQNAKEDSADEEVAHVKEEAEEVEIEVENSNCAEVITLSEDEGSPEAKYTLYRCRKCLGCVSSAQKGDYHTMYQLNCTDMPRRRCKLCDLDFVVRFLRPHEDKHRELADFTRENIRIVNFGEASKESKLSRTKFVLYQCSECLICSQEPYEHLCEDVERRHCKLCQYDIEASCFSKHLEYHKSDTYQRSAIKILPLDSNAVSDNDAPFRGRKRTVHGDMAEKKTVDVYKCSCGLHFLCQKSLAKHDFMCQGVAKEKSGLPCSKCNMVFDATQLLKHSISHHGNVSFDIKYNIIESVSKADQCRKCGTEFMRGDRCPKCVKPRKSYYYYKKVSRRKPVKKKACPKCGLRVSVANFSRHLQRHQRVTDPITNRYTTQQKNAIRKRMFGCKRCLVLFMTEESYGSHKRSYNHTAPPHEQCSYCKLLIFKGQLSQHILRFHTNNRSSGIVGRVLYYCAACDVHFFKMSTLQRHYYVRDSDGGDHVKVKEVHPCPQCGLPFSKYGLKVHLVAHHGTKSYKREDFIIKDVHNKTIWDAKRDLQDIEEGAEDEDNSEIEAESRDMKVKEEPKFSGFEESNAENASADGSEVVAESIVSAVTKSGESVTYYKCTECYLHFFKLTTLQKHMYLMRAKKKRHLFINTHSCPNCGLTFTRCGLKRHLNAHKSLSCESQEFIINDVLDATIKIHSAGVEQDEDDTKDRSWLEVPIKEECSINESDVTKDPIKQEIIESDDTNAENASVNLTDDEIEFVPSVTGIKRLQKGVTYYKCAECDVHFLKYDVVQKHLAKHKPIPVYDFLECKLCKLNFKINSLRTHMDHHKNVDFSLDKVHFIVYDRKGKVSSKDEGSLVSVKDEYREDTVSIEENQRQDSDENILELLMEGER